MSDIEFYAETRDGLPVQVTYRHIDANIVIDVNGLFVEWPLHIAAEVATALVGVLAQLAVP
jgi:hypothetical protein